MYLIFSHSEPSRRSQFSTSLILFIPFLILVLCLFYFFLVYFYVHSKCIFYLFVVFSFGELQYTPKHVEEEVGDSWPRLPEGCCLYYTTTWAT